MQFEHETSAVARNQFHLPQVQRIFPIQLKGHTNQVNEVAFSHDCTMAASGSLDCSIIIWCLKTMKQLKQYNCPMCVGNVAFSKCDSFLANSQKDFDQPNCYPWIIIWDLTIDKPIYQFGGHTNYIQNLIFAENFLLCCGDQSIQLWNNKKIDYYELEYARTKVALSQDEKLIVGSCGSIWQVGKCKRIIKWNMLNKRTFKSDICFSKNSKLIYSTSHFLGELKAWNCYSGQGRLLRKTLFNQQITTLNISSDSSIISIVEDNFGSKQKGYLHQIDISTWKLIQHLQVGIQQYYDYGSCNFSNDDQYIASSCQDLKNGEISIFMRQLGHQHYVDGNALWLYDKQKFQELREDIQQ